MGRRTIPGFLLGLMVNPLFGQTPNMISFQGLIKDNMGNPITVPVDLEFRIYDALTLGNLVDMDGDGVVEDICGQDVTCVPAVTPTNGIVSTKFGPIRATAFDGTDRFLEVRVDGTPLSRIEMATAPAASEQVNIPASGTAAIEVDTNGNVGIGNSAPAAKLDVTGDLRVTGNLRTPGKPYFVASSTLGWYTCSVGHQWLTGFNDIRAGNSGGWLDTTTSIFTAPVAGLYMFSMHSYRITPSTEVGYIQMAYTCNGEGVAGWCAGRGQVGNYHTLQRFPVTQGHNVNSGSNTYFVHMNVGDTIRPKMFCSGSLTNVFHYGNAQWVGILIQKD